MIAAQGDRQFAFVQGTLYGATKPFAGAAYLTEILELILGPGRLLNSIRYYVSMIPNIIPQLSNAGFESSHAHHRGPQLNAHHIGAVTQWHAENAYGFFLVKQRQL